MFYLPGGEKINGANIIVNLLVGLIALAVGYFIRKYIAAKINSAEESAKIIEDAQNQAEAIKENPH